MIRVLILAAALTGMVFALVTLAGCNGDIGSPFEKPDETTQPVACGQQDCK